MEVAVSVTALVHLANNLFKLALMGRQADRGVVLRFGVPAVLAAFAGALTLGWLAGLPPLWEYQMASRELAVMPVKLAVGLLILGFVVMELLPAAAAWRFVARLLPVGGLVSGFFGGLSGNQGAFRTMFLLKAGLSKEQFIATGVVLAVIVDLARLPVNGTEFFNSGQKVDTVLLAVACFAAFAGSFLASRLLKKLTVRFLQFFIGALLILVAAGMIAGVL